MSEISYAYLLCRPFFHAPQRGITPGANVPINWVNGAISMGPEPVYNDMYEWTRRWVIEYGYQSGFHV